MPRFLTLLLGLLCGSALMLPPPLAAQPESPMPPVTPTAPMESADNGVIYLPDKSGKPVPVPRGASLEQYLQWLQNQKGPPFYVSSVSLKGTAEDDRVQLQAVVKIQINREDEWVRVPLRFNEAVLRETTYNGEGETSFDKFDRDTGYNWWIKGKGVHELSLALMVPLQKQLPTRRLQLAIPPSAASQLTLEVPIPRLNVTPPANSVLRTKSTGTNSEIELIGLSERLDLQWVPLPNPRRVETVLQSFTSITAELTGDTLLLTAWQQVQALQGTFTEVVTQLPPGFELLEIEINGTLYNSLPVIEEQTRKVTLPLVEETSGPVEIKWTLQANLNEQQQITLSGFQVQQARRMTGEIAVRTVEGFRLAYNTQQNQFVYRMNASDVVHPQVTKFLTKEESVSTFRYLRPDFQLNLAFSEIEPYFSAQPAHQLTISDSEINLESKFHYDVYRDRGTVQEVQIIWPAENENDWVIAPVELPGLVESTEVVQQGDQRILRIRLLERQKDSFELTIKARKSLAGKKGGRQSFSLPVTPATSHLPGTLTVITSDNVSAKITADGNAPLQFIRQFTTPQKQPAEQYELRPREQKLNAEITVHNQALTTRSELTATFGETALQVQQKLIYRVEYEKLPQVRLKVPQSLESKVSFFLADGSPLTPTWTGLDVGSLKEARFMLPEAVLGDIELLVRHEQPLPLLEDDTSAALTIPLIQSSDAPFAQIQIGFENNLEWQVDLLGEEEAWERTTAGTTVWKTSQPALSVTTRLRHQPELPTQNFRIRKALIRAVYDIQGVFHCRAQYEIEGDMASMLITFPQEIELTGLYWNKSSLQENVELVDKRRAVFRLKSPPANPPQSTQLLTVEYHATRDNPFSWSSSLDLYAPQFADNVWIEQAVWQITLPDGQHLLTHPRGLTPEFTWQPSPVLWSRITVPARQNLDTWIESENGPAPQVDFLNGNTYVFSRHGRVEPVKFRTLSRTSLMALGAGLALLLGVALIKFNFTRSFLTVLGVAFVIALASLRYADPVYLFLQPAAVGFTLALLVALLDRLFRREIIPPVITFNSSVHDLSLPSTTVPLDPSGLSLTELRPGSTQHRTVPADAGSSYHAEEAG